MTPTPKPRWRCQTTEHGWVVVAELDREGHALRCMVLILRRTWQEETEKHMLFSTAIQRVQHDLQAMAASPVPTYLTR